MKLIIYCNQCSESCKNDFSHIFITHYYDHGFVINECPNGHKFATVLQSHKFEMLLRSGADALIDGYTIEACSSFCSAYERFIEYCLKIFSKKININNSNFNTTFQQIKKQSERQLGAFLFLYVSIFGEGYKFDNKIIEFRNRVIHQGYIPDLDEAHAFCEKIYDTIFELTRKVKADLWDQYVEVITEIRSERATNIPADIPQATTTGTLFYDTVRADQKKSFKEALNEYKEVRGNLFEAGGNLLKII